MSNDKLTLKEMLKKDIADRKRLKIFAGGNTKIKEAKRALHEQFGRRK